MSFLYQQILRYTALTVIWLCVANLLTAQTSAGSTTNAPSVVPASPEAASLGKFGQISVGYYHGLPEISIPLFTIEEGEIKLPITMGYHAGGVKVEEMASWTGLDWALSAGGVITRSLKDLEDEEVTMGYRNFGDSARLYANNQLTPTQATGYELSLFRKRRDGQADIFFFNFGGNSGKFFYSDSGQLYTSPRSDLKVQYDDTNTGWIITDGKGIKYSFFNRERTTTEPFCKAGTGAYVSNGANDNFSAWFLSKIQDPLGNTVTLVYDYFSNTYKTKNIDTYNQMQLTGPACPATTNTCYQQLTSNTYRIKEIDFSNGKIVFTTNPTPRSDNPSDLALQTITEYNLNNEIIKSFNFYTGYFNTSTIGGCDDGIAYRLRLDSLQEIGANGYKKSPYRFSYNTDYPLPCRLSNAQDHWGYYNGQNNTTFVRYKTTLNAPWSGAVKDPDSLKVKAGILQKMTYPTGGNTQFTFESNRYSDYTPQGFDTGHPVYLSNLTGDNNNATNGGNYIVTFNTTITVSPVSIPAPGYRYAKVSLSTTCSNNSLYHALTMKVTGTNGYTKTVVDGDTLHLIADTYTITGTIETEVAGNPYCSFNLLFNEFPYTTGNYKNLLYGGLRIMQIQNYDEHNSPTGVQTFVYNRFDVNGKMDTTSSGTYSGVPDQSYYEYDKSNCLDYDPITNDPRCCPIHVYNSVSTYPLMNVGGSPISYSNVTVYYGLNGSNGMEQFSYTSYADYPATVSYTFPFYFASEYDWRQGLLLKKATYRYSNGGYIPIQKKTTVYDFHASDTTFKTARCVLVGKTTEWPAATLGEDLYDLAGLVSTYYIDHSEAFNVLTDTTVVYDKNSVLNFTSLINSYAYSPKNFQLVKQTTINSKNEKIISNVTYPTDFTLSGTPTNPIAQGIKNLQNINSVESEVEKYIQKSNADGSNLRTISSTFNSYKSTIPLPDIYYKTEATAPITGFTPASVSISAATLDSRYQPQTYFDRYNSAGNIAQQHKINDGNHTYIWDYQSKYPIAEISNADSSSVAHTSFEADGKGNWTFTGTVTTVSVAPFPPTGFKYYNLTPTTTVSKSGLLSGTVYIISYWSKNGAYSITGGTAVGIYLTGKTINGWTYYEHKISATSSALTISGTGSLDEVRLYPEMSLMTTYTYAPLAGMTSKCDPENVITYYVYDGLQRLKWIKDQDGNIIKTVEYHYQAGAGTTF